MQLPPVDGPSAGLSSSAETLAKPTVFGAWLLWVSSREPEVYNDDAGLGGAIDDAVLASRCVGSWPAQLKALQEC